MTRIPRSQLDGHLHHVFARGAARQQIFVDHVDRRRYLLLLAREARRVGWRCLTYCLMGNHMHLLLETPVPELSTGMQRLQGVYAQGFNRRHKRSGHLFERRFNAVGVESDAQLWGTVNYIVQNPVVAGLCRTPEAWPWSSHAAVLTQTPLPWLDERRLLAYFAVDGGNARRRYVELVS